jgi:hypothetical protein
MSFASSMPAVETDLAIATRCFMQAEASVTQAEARVLQQWNDLKAIVSKPPQERQDRELEIAEAALEFAKAANARAEKAYAAAEVDKAKAASQADAAASANASSSTSSPNALCDSCRPFAAASKRRHAIGDEDDDECEMVDLDDKDEEHGSAGKRSKSSSSSSSSEALATSTASLIEITRADVSTQA